MTRIRTLSASTVLIAALALAVSGCGGSNTAATTSHKQSSTGSGAAQTASTPATTTSSPPTTTATTSTATTSTSTTAASGGAGLSGLACTAADLTPAFLNSNGATGHVVIAFVLKNTGSSTCHTYGFPGVEFLTKSGAPITTNATRTTTDFAGHLSEVEVTVPPGSEASFRLVTSDVASSQSACQTARGLQIYAPDDTTPMKTTMPVGISVCNGTATVSPVVAGTGASST
ncbi:MAG TPA: DUF4232 domain-containing protein [Acidimicrobiales bacterium]|nr:DUF4232 domain-containing protein [Acidimicrobiales bacterium]